MDSLRDIAQGTRDNAMGQGDAPRGVEPKIHVLRGDETAPNLGEEGSFHHQESNQQDRSQLMNKDDDGLDPLVHGLQASLIADEEQDDSEPFVIARKLLRRRHVRKEQLRKEREANKRKAVLSSCQLRVDTSMPDDGRRNKKYPRLSPIEMFEETTSGTSSDPSTSSVVSPEKPLGGRVDGPPVAMVTTTFATSMLNARLVLAPTGFSISPVRPRARRARRANRKQTSS